ncbi:SecDF P1 head subdomain-containing protein [Actinomadura sp. 6N118]|uniref:SecDF P1 head subdomain-containing protein n=1 Tax=Actinomadura sp. 6N118 TaxID=3375151 RepID=UPI00379AEC5D
MGQPYTGTPPGFGPPAPQRRAGLIIGLAAVAFAVLVAMVVIVTIIVLGDDDEGGGTGAVQLQKPLRLQLVAKSSPPPCQPGTQVDTQGTCYQLAPTMMDVIRVKDMRAAPPEPQQGATSWTVKITLTATDAPKFADLSRQAYQDFQQKGSTAGQIAMMVDGRIQSAPAVNNGPITGGELVITGPSTTFSKQYTQDLVRRLTGKSD